MTPAEALAIACERCVTAATLLAASRLPAGTDDASVGRTLASGVVCGWADPDSVGTADARGISVRGRGQDTSLRVTWTQVAAALRPALREPGVGDRLADAYRRYVAAATDRSVAGRLDARAATAELAQTRRAVLDRYRAAPEQQTLFPIPPTRGPSPGSAAERVR